MMPAKGPSIPFTMNNFAPLDVVVAFKCDAPDITRQFMERRRKYNQPSAENLEQVSQLDSHVVPVGSKCGVRPDLEWRICYTKAELHLLRSLNETQIKMYIMLKLLAKSCLDGESETISSYCLKNLVLWMAERLPTAVFTPELLLQRLLDALQLLRQCVKNKRLPCYMIPERNLFAEKMKRPKQLKVMHQLTKMLNEGSNVVLLCPRLREAMDKMHDSPVEFRQTGKRRDNTEQGYNQLMLPSTRSHSSEADDMHDSPVEFRETGTRRDDFELVSNRSHSSEADDMLDLITKQCEKDFEDFKEKKIDDLTLKTRVFAKVNNLFK